MMQSSIKPPWRCEAPRGLQTPTSPRHIVNRAEAFRHDQDKRDEIRGRGSQKPSLARTARQRSTRQRRATPRLQVLRIMESPEASLVAESVPVLTCEPIQECDTRVFWAVAGPAERNLRGLRFFPRQEPQQSTGSSAKEKRWAPNSNIFIVRKQP